MRREGGSYRVIAKGGKPELVERTRRIGEADVRAAEADKAEPAVAKPSAPKAKD